MSDKGTLVYIWPDGTWYSADEHEDLNYALNWKSDDYSLVLVTEWDETGAPADKYFTELGIYNA